MYITFIRHGESQDNMKPIWSGWKDSPLSKLGERAEALGKVSASTHFTHIYASDLKRAHATATALHSRLTADPKPPLTTSTLLREQHFGIAEGKGWVPCVPEGATLAELHAKEVYPTLRGRELKYEGGESLDDVARRAEEALKECVLPHLDADHDQKHVVIVSHGLAISEMVAALTRLDPDFESHDKRTYRGLANTGWARVRIVGFQDGYSSNGPIDVNNPPPLRVEVTHFNECQHLNDITQEVTTEKCAEVDEARKFFGGGGSIAKATSGPVANPCIGESNNGPSNASL